MIDLCTKIFQPIFHLNQRLQGDARAPAIR